MKFANLLLFILSLNYDRFCGVEGGKMVQLEDLVRIWNNCFPIYQDGVSLQSILLLQVSSLDSAYRHNLMCAQM